jgi:hypothetical protein
MTTSLNKSAPFLHFNFRGVTMAGGSTWRVVSSKAREGGRGGPSPPSGGLSTGCWTKPTGGMVDGEPGAVAVDWQRELWCSPGHLA